MSQLKAIRVLLSFSSPEIRTTLANLYGIFRGRDSSFSYSQGLYRCTSRSTGEEIYFQDFFRGYTTYGVSLQQRYLDVAQSYFLDTIIIQNGDTVIDVGANHGDIFRYFKGRGITPDYIAIEPGPGEAKSLALNCEGATIIQAAASNYSGTSEFFYAPNRGDSSLEEPQDGYAHKITVETTTLAEVISSLKSRIVKLLKVEAEGSEPEVLEGLGSWLNQVAFVAVDGGPERGVRAESTLEYCTNFLVSKGFEVVSFGYQRGNGRALFKNASLSEL